MKKLYKGNHSSLSWEDVYLDGYLSDTETEYFCEDTQHIYRRKKVNDGWDDPEDFVEDVEWED